MATKFGDKIGYNSADIWDISEIFACNMGFSGSRYWMMPDKFDHDQTPVAMATNFVTKTAITQLIQEISLRCLRITGGFRGPAIKLCQSNFTTTDPGCHSNEIWDNTGYNSACIENIAAPLAPSRGYSWVGYWMMSAKFYHDQPRCHGNKFKTKIAYNSSCIRYISEMLASNRRFPGTGYRIINDVSKILRGAILVVMATKFETKSATTRFV